MALPASLPGLSTRDAIIDAIHRTTNAYDYADESLLASALTQDITFELGDMKFQGLKTLKENNFNFVKTLDTAHFVSGIRVDYDESKGTGELSCNFQNFHYHPGKGFGGSADDKFVALGRYACEVVKEGGLWKIRHWRMTIVSTDGNQGVMAP